MKSDFGLSNKRVSSGELHLDHCPVTFFALPRVNGASLSDVVVCANIRPRFSVTGAGKVRYVGQQPAKGGCDAGRHTLTTIGELR